MYFLTGFVWVIELQLQINHKIKSNEENVLKMYFIIRYIGCFEMYKLPLSRYDSSVYKTFVFNNIKKSKKAEN